MDSPDTIYGPIVERHRTACSVPGPAPPAEDPVITVFRTEVLDLAPTPMGLLPRRWRVAHRCETCRVQVETEELISHARAHAGDGGEHNEPHLMQ